MSDGLTKAQKTSAVNWIRSDPARLQTIQDLSACIAPRKYREVGWTNDEANEARLAPLPFTDITAPTLIAHGLNDSIVPIEQATNAADRIAGAELMLVEEGRHGLSLSRNFGPVARRELELARG